MSRLGTIATVVLKPGFGRLTDYLLAVTMAFGVPTVGAAIMPNRTVLSAATQQPSPVGPSTQSVVGSKGTQKRRRRISPSTLDCSSLTGDAVVYVPGIDRMKLAEGEGFVLDRFPSLSGLRAFRSARIAGSA